MTANTPGRPRNPVPIRHQSHPRASGVGCCSEVAEESVVFVWQVPETGRRTDCRVDGVARVRAAAWRMRAVGLSGAERVACGAGRLADRVPLFDEATARCQGPSGLLRLWPSDGLRVRWSRRDPCPSRGRSRRATPVRRSGPWAHCLRSHSLNRYFTVVLQGVLPACAPPSAAENQLICKEIW